MATKNIQIKILEASNLLEMANIWLTGKAGKKFFFKGMLSNFQSKFYIVPIEKWVSSK